MPTSTMTASCRNTQLYMTDKFPDSMKILSYAHKMLGVVLQGQ